MMIRSALKLAARLSPALGRAIRDTQVTINGWRFDELKHHIDERLANGFGQASHGAFEASLNVLRERAHGRSQRRRIAFVSNMPPDTTGIASCSFYSWLGSEVAVDLFCPASDLDWFTRNRLILCPSQAEYTDCSVQVLDVSCFLTAMHVNEYEAIILAIGNSNHNLYLHGVLKKVIDAGLSGRCVAYIHDPCLLNFLQMGLRLPPHTLAAYLADLYGTTVDVSRGLPNSDWELYGSLIRRGVMGLRFFREFGVRHFLVNSAAAQQIVENDLAGCEVTVKRVFHPAFLPLGAEPLGRQPKARRASDPIAIGTFGIPCNAKRIDELIDATHRLAAAGNKVKLVLAGFGVADFVRRNSDRLAGLDILRHDGPSDLQLVGYMQSVDVAVQLRAENLGESSGVVSQLLMLSCPTIVSNVGSFAEFGAAVIPIAAAAPAADIASAIMEAMQSPPSAEAMRTYVENHSPARFRAALLEALMEFGLLGRHLMT